MRIPEEIRDSVYVAGGPTSVAAATDWAVLVRLAHCRDDAAMTPTAGERAHVFRPARSLGFLWMALLGLVPALPVLALAASFSGVPWFAAMVAVPALLIAGPFLFLAALYPTMRHELDAEALTLRYGPILRYRIPLGTIQSVERWDLDPSARSSLRVPGLALFQVAYVDAGIVRMCATRVGDRILLIKTASDQYGMTPADEDGFLSELRRRLGDSR